jgi:hypothetical protein
MKRSLAVLLLILFLIVGCSNRPEPSSSERVRQLLTKFEGQWEDTSGNQEWWSWMENDTMVGEGYVMENGELQLMEKLRIVWQESAFVYQATVSGQNEGNTIDFPLATANDSMLVFENPKHDFPNRISYCFCNDSSLFVRAESFSDTSKYFELAFKRKN